jgi:hypothetical protein
MAAASDILQSVTTGDYEWSANGDFTIGLSDNQHQVDIIQSNKGSWKQYPLCGVGINNYLNASGATMQLKKEITTQLTTDGYSVNDIIFSSNEVDSFTVDAIRG